MKELSEKLREILDKKLDRIMAAGADGYLVKPVETPVLLQHVEGLLNHGGYDLKVKDRPCTAGIS